MSLKLISRSTGCHFFLIAVLFMSVLPAAMAQGTFTPTERQKSLAAETTSRFVTLKDQSRYADAYAMLSASLQRVLSKTAFERMEASFAAVAGGDGRRSGMRLAWFKDPPRAEAPGVYAAVKLRCHYRNVNLCEETLMLHERTDGSFDIIRQERNYVDKETEAKMRFLR